MLSARVSPWRPPTRGSRQVHGPPCLSPVTSPPQSTAPLRRTPHPLGHSAPLRLLPLQSPFLGGQAAPGVPRGAARCMRSGAQSCRLPCGVPWKGPWLLTANGDLPRDPAAPRGLRRVGCHGPLPLFTIIQCPSADTGTGGRWQVHAGDVTQPHRGTEPNTGCKGRASQT